MKFESPQEWNQHVIEYHNISSASKNGTGKFVSISGEAELGPFLPNCINDHDFFFVSDSSLSVSDSA